MFNNRWSLVALHHASVESDATSGGRRSPGADPRLRFLNEGVRLSAIALWLDSSEAHHPEIHDHTARLRALFEGLDPQAGFFGALGRKVRGRHAAQLVVECYQRAGETLDLAAWDLSGGRRPVRDRLADLAWVMAEMGLDLWFFQGLSPDDARRLSEHLDTHFRLDFQVFPDAWGTSALLVSRASGLDVETLPQNPPGRRRKGSGAAGRATKARAIKASSSSTGMQVRLSPLGRRPIDLWLWPSGGATSNPARLRRRVRNRASRPTQSSSAWAGP